MAISPAVIAGVGASVLTPVLSKLLSAFGLGGDDPEESLYSWLEENIGDKTSDFARFGVFGLGGRGVSLKGSLAIGVLDVPTDIKGLLGAHGSMLSDIYYGGKNIIRGDYSKGVEKLAPMNAIGSMIKSVREGTEGVTTTTNAPVFYGRKQLKPDLIDSVLRFASFNPASVAGPKERIWKDKKIESKYRSMKTDIYAKIKKYYLLPKSKRTKAKWVDILLEIRKFNERIKNRRLQRVASPITRKSIRAYVRRSFRPPKKERLRR